MAQIHNGRWFNTVRSWYFQPGAKVPWTFLLLGLYIHETVQNQSRKTSVIGLPKFTIVKMARKCHHHATFTIENLIFEDYSFGSPMTDVFLDWFWILLYIWKPQKQETSWNFWSRLKIPGAHCVMYDVMCINGEHKTWYLSK